MRELETTMTQKGQVTIPREIRSRLGLKPKDRVRFEMEGEVVVLRPSSSMLLAGYGSVEPKNRPEDWGKVREEVEHGIAEEVVSEG
jgi:antitoxin PrlF